MMSQRSHEKGAGERGGNNALLFLPGLSFLFFGVVDTHFLTRTTAIAERLFHDGRVLEEEDVVLSSDHNRSLPDKHVELCRVEPVLDSLDHPVA